MASPLFSTELARIRGETPVAAFASKCGITREMVRLIEQGKRLPSNEILERWLAHGGFSLEQKPDIVRSVLAARGESNKWVREAGELHKVLVHGEFDVTEFKRATLARVTEYLEDAVMLEAEEVEGHRYMLKKLLDEL